MRSRKRSCASSRRCSPISSRPPGWVGIAPLTRRTRTTTPRTAASRSRSTRRKRRRPPSSMAPRSRSPLWSLRIPPPRMTRRLVGVGAMGVILLGWWFVTSGLGSEDRLISPVILPSPGEVFRSFPVLLRERGLLESIAATLRRVLLGFGLAALIGVPLGIIAGSWRVIESAGAPLALFGRTLPIAALIPLTILWFGIDETQKG